MEIALTPRFFENHLTAWSPTKAEPNNYVGLAFNGVSFNADHWHANYTTPGKTRSGPPTTIFILVKEDDDDNEGDDDAGACCTAPASTEPTSITSAPAASTEAKGLWE